MTTERWERGLASRKAVRGEEFAGRNQAEADWLPAELDRESNA